MNSRGLAAHGFVLWLPFNRAGERDLLERTPEEPGVYAFGRLTPYTRRVGESDIVYIGSAANERGLKMRLRQYFHPGPTQHTNRRILALVGDSKDYEVAFTQVPSRSVARGLEAKLLQMYRAEHGELPPENRRRA